MSLVLRVPGDKSISHRVLVLAGLARVDSRVEGLLDAADVRSTAAALRELGAEIPSGWDEEVRLGGSTSWHGVAGSLDCGNSGTTARLLAGLVAGLGLETVLDGDASLRRRPMDRVVYPLQAMGARIAYLGERDRLPVALRARASGSLRPLRHRPRVASAQVKSSLLLAGLTSGTRVEVIEPGRSRDHTERLMAAMGAPIEFGPCGEEGARALFDPGDEPPALRSLRLRVPGDASSAAFLVGAALLAGRPLRIEGVGLNPTRTGYLDVLRRMGAVIDSRATGEEAGEPVGDLFVEPGELTGTEIEPVEVPGLLDELPLLAVLAARARGTTSIRGAAELRVKESDRLALLATNLEALGVACREREDGLEISGSAGTLTGVAVTGGDHRISMAFGALSAHPNARVRVDDPACVGVSYPGFWDDLRRLTGEGG